MLSLLAEAANQPIYWSDLGLTPGIDLGFFTLRWYSLAYIAGIVLAYWHLSRMIKAPGTPMNQTHVDDLLFYCTLGVIFGGWLALEFGGAGPWVMPAMLLLGGVGGALWAAIPALLKTRFNASEILTSLMLNYCAQLWLAYLVFGPWRDPAGFNFPQSAPLHPDALLPIVIENTRANIEIVLAVASCAAGVWFGTVAFMGYFARPTGAAVRIAFFLAAIALLIPANAFPGAGWLEIGGACLAALLAVTETRGSRISNSARANA